MNNAVANMFRKIGVYLNMSTVYMFRFYYEGSLT